MGAINESKRSAKTSTGDGGRVDWRKGVVFGDAWKSRESRVAVAVREIRLRGRKRSGRSTGRPWGRAKRKTGVEEEARKQSSSRRLVSGPTSVRLVEIGSELS